jgi:uncharacterized protein (DUF2141 family)
MRVVGFAMSIAIAVSTVTAAGAQSANKISATIGGLRNDAGVVRCGLYASADGFRQPGREFRGAVAPIRGQRATCVFGNVPPGTYAIAAFHAEHNEAQIETGAFGKPKQGYGFSGNPSGSFGPPSFSDAAFEHRSVSQGLQIRLQY